MILFSIKKAFFDSWDYFLPLVLCNLGFVVLLTIPTLAPSLFVAASPLLGVVAFVAGVLAVFVYLGTTSMIARDIVNYQTLEWASIPVYLGQTWRASVFLAIIYLLHAFLLSVALPTYAVIGNVLAPVAMALLFWASIIWLTASLFYLPLRSQLDSEIGKLLKKSFLLVLDNPGFALVVACGAVTLLLVSLFTALLLPGIMGVMVWLNAALKLRLYKYDYLQKNPHSKPRDIPWGELLREDQERVGTRTLKGMLFPWKE